MNDVQRLLHIIAANEGRVITSRIAEQARHLMGPVEADGSPELEMMKGQLLILMVKQLGGRVSFTIDEIDNGTKNYVLLMQLSKNRKSIQFKTRRKDKI